MSNDGTNGAIELENSEGIKFKGNGQRVKNYLDDVDNVKVVCDVDHDRAKVIMHT